MTAVLLCCIILGLVICVTVLYRVEKNMKRELEAVNAILSVHYSLETGHFDAALDRMPALKDRADLRREALGAFWMRAATLCTTPSLSANHRGAFTDDELLDTLCLVVDYKVAPCLPRRAMQCAEVAEQLMSSSQSRERAYATCVISAYYKEDDKTHIRGLRERLTTSTWNWMPLQYRVSTLGANRQSSEIVELLRSADLVTSCPDPVARQDVALDLLTAYARLGDTTEALRLCQKILADPDVATSDVRALISTAQRKLTSHEGR